MRKKLLSIFMLIFLFHFNSFGKKLKDYSAESQKSLFNEIVSNIYIRIDDPTSISKKPTKKVLLLTKTILNGEQLKEYNERLSLKNKNDDLHDYVNYRIIEYTLKNQKGENIQIIENIPTQTLGETSLSKDNGKLYQDLYINLILDKEFIKLEGMIKIEFTLGKDNKTNIDIPVKISIYDEK